MEISLKNKKALVTGGGTGIGQYIVKALSESGAKVAFTSRNNSSLNNTMKMLKNKSNHFPYKIDLSKKKISLNLKKYLKKILETLIFW